MKLRISILLIVFMIQIFDTEARMNLHEYETVWASATDSKSLGDIQRSYGFAYDSMNRLKSAVYHDSYSNTRNFGESYTYDLNCNITTLKRYGMTLCANPPFSFSQFGLIDDLTFTRCGNRLKKVYDRAEELSYYGALDVTDGTDVDEEFSWDSNGNMTKNRNKGISSVEYNVLNLPSKVQFNNLHQIHYTYDAHGRKLGAQYILVTLNAITPEFPLIKDIESIPYSQSYSLTVEMNRDYLGNHVYENDTLKSTITPVGFLMNDTLYAYVKNYRGNIRSVIDEFGNVVETNLYYPYGGVMVDILEQRTSVQPHKYEGKEFDREYGLNMYDYHARLYDPYLGGFDNRDPQAEKYPDISPYAFCAANPNRFIDPTGKAWLPIIEKRDNGKHLYFGFEWISPENSYNNDGTLKAGLYEQAILFTDNETFDKDSKYNIGSSTAIVYTSDGKTKSFAANTMPSDSKKYATVPEGFYHATVGLHKRSYIALRLSDIDNSGKIYLGEPNPSNPSRNYSVGINIHKPGVRNLTGITTKGSAISQGCLLIDIYKWTDFISIFNTTEQVKNIIGVIIQRK